MNNKLSRYFQGNFLRILAFVFCASFATATFAIELTPQEVQMKQKADDAFAASDIAEAMKYYARLNHNHPEDNELEYKLARCYYLAGMYSYAARHANNLITRNPQSIDALMVLVQVSLSNNHVGEAKAYLQAILSIDSHHAEAWRLMNDVLGREGDQAGAEAANAKYLQYQP